MFDPSRRTLTIDLAGRTLDLHDRQAVNLELLQSIRIIGHRGLNLASEALQNSREALAYCWYFGCTGAELDVTVPFRTVSGSRVPAPEHLVIWHAPEVRAEITGNDTADLSLLGDQLRLGPALKEAAAHGVRLVYLDLKLRWLIGRREPPAAAIENVVAETEGMSSPQSPTILIGAELSGPNQTADLLRARVRPTDTRGWALEYTRRTDDSRFWNYVERADPTPGYATPSAVSLNILRVRSISQGWLGWMLSDMAESTRRLRSARRPIILWTPHTTNQHREVVEFLTRALGSDLNVLGAAVITPYPHRLAFLLASRT